MTRQKSIFLAFTGEAIEQSAPIFQMKDGYECWDLKKLSLDTFIDTLKIKIPPLNNNVLRNYKITGNKANLFGLTEEEYEKVSWGLFIPDALPDTMLTGYSETMFLINLYSPRFLYPMFWLLESKRNKR